MGVDTSIEEKADEVVLSSNATPTPDEPKEETGWGAYKVTNNPPKRKTKRPMLTIGRRSESSRTQVPLSTRCRASPYLLPSRPAPESLSKTSSLASSSPSSPTLLPACRLPPNSAVMYPSWRECPFIVPKLIQHASRQYKPKKIPLLTLTKGSTSCTWELADSSFPTSTTPS